jgi:hypothetical protein
VPVPRKPNTQESPPNLAWSARYRVVLLEDVDKSAVAVSDGNSFERPVPRFPEPLLILEDGFLHDDFRHARPQASSEAIMSALNRLDSR